MVKSVGPYSARFAARLKELRLQTSMTGSEVAEIMRSMGCKLTDRSYYRWEAGANMPSFDLLPALSQVLALQSVKDLFPDK